MENVSAEHVHAFWGANTVTWSGHDCLRYCIGPSFWSDLCLTQSVTNIARISVQYVLQNE